MVGATALTVRQARTLGLPVESKDSHESLAKKIALAKAVLAANKKTPRGA